MEYHLCQETVLDPCPGAPKLHKSQWMHQKELRHDIGLKINDIQSKPYSMAGADPGFFLGGGALISCATSTPINHIVFFFCRKPVVLENRRSSRGGGGAHPLHLPLDPPLTGNCREKITFGSDNKDNFVTNQLPPWIEGRCLIGLLPCM